MSDTQVDIEKLALEVELLKKALRWILFSDPWEGEPYVRMLIADKGVREIVSTSEEEEVRFHLTPAEVAVLER